MKRGAFLLEWDVLLEADREAGCAGVCCAQADR